MYIYDGHLGFLYAENEPRKFDELYCDICNDYDREIGEAETPLEVLMLLADKLNHTPEEGGWNLDYVLNFANDTFPEAKKIGLGEAIAILGRY